MLSFPLGNPKWSSCSFNEEIPLQEIAELTKWPLSFDWIELHLIWNIHCKLIELLFRGTGGKQLDHSIHACLANSDALTPDSGTQKKSKQKALSTLFKRHTLLSLYWIVEPAWLWGKNRIGTESGLFIGLKYIWNIHCKLIGLLIRGKKGITIAQPKPGNIFYWKIQFRNVHPRKN